jgi:Sec-independent protein translocase protein TatA
MEILNIGPLEIITVLIIMIILLGPQETIRTVYRVGRFIRDVVRSPQWREITGFSKVIRKLPQQMMSETGLEKAMQEIKEITDQTASEVNEALDETIQAARVPEVEHLKVEPSQETPDLRGLNDSE